MNESIGKKDRSEQIQSFLNKHLDSELWSEIQEETDKGRLQLSSQNLNDNWVEHTTQINSLQSDGDIAHIGISIRENTASPKIKGKPIADYYITNNQIFGLDYRCIGPCKYFYPNGEVAGVEIYTGTCDIPAKGIYFTPTGERTTQAMSDVLLRQEYSEIGITYRQLEFLPRFKEYNELVNDLKNDYLSLRPEIESRSLQEFILEDMPAAYRDMLARDVKDSLANKDFSKEFVNVLNNEYIYGKSVPAINYSFDIEFLNSLGITGNFVTGTIYEKKGKALERVAYPSLLQNHKSLTHVVYKDVETGKMMCQELLKNHEVHYRDIYYKDGSPCLVLSGKDDYNPETYDSYGRMCTYNKAQKSLQADWGFETQVMELKYNNSSENIPVRLTNTYATGFDENILLFEINGTKVPPKDWDLATLPKGESTVRIHLNTERKILLPQDLFKGCDCLTSAKLIGIDAKQIVDKTNRFNVAKINNNKPKISTPRFGL